MDQVVGHVGDRRRNLPTRRQRLRVERAHQLLALFGAHDSRFGCIGGRGRSGFRSGSCGGFRGRRTVGSAAGAWVGAGAGACSRSSPPRRTVRTTAPSRRPERCTNGNACSWDIPFSPLIVSSLMGKDCFVPGDMLLSDHLLPILLRDGHLDPACVSARRSCGLMPVSVIKR